MWSHSHPLSRRLSRSVSRLAASDIFRRGSSPCRMTERGLSPRSALLRRLPHEPDELEDDLRALERLLAFLAEELVAGISASCSPPVINSPPNVANIPSPAMSSSRPRNRDSSARTAVNPVEKVVPPPVAQLRGARSRVNDVGEEHGRQDAFGLDASRAPVRTF